jgi:ABC-2 type transport system permease protein
MNARIILTIMKKDLKEVRQNKGALIPAVIVPLVFMVLFPAVIILVPTRIESVAQQMFTSPEGFAKIQQYLAPFLGEQIAGLSGPAAWIKLTTGYYLAPFLMIMPLMLSTIIGAESFVGEKERKTLEALLYTPASDAELFMGKLLASCLPAVGLAWIGFLIYAITVNLAALPVMGGIWFPLPNWWPLMLWLTPAIATLGMAISVLISVKANTFMEAYQLSGSLVVLVVALIAGQIAGVLVLNVGVTLLLGAGLWIIDAVLIRYSVRIFSRTSLISRL